MVQVRVVGVAVDSRSQPLILLKPLGEEPGTGSMLPIWIGAQEATSAFIALEGETPPRPLTHDLLKSVIDALAAKVERVEVTRIEGGTFYAEITLATNAGAQLLDCRPSDAIALAIRADAPIWVADEVLEDAGIADTAVAVVDEESKVAEFKRFLDEVDPDQFRQ